MSERASLKAGRLDFVPLAAEHFFALDRQDSQATQYGLDPLDMEWSTAEAVAAQPNCWAALRGVEVLACLGISESFPGVQGVAWAFLGRGIGRDHHALTRFAREVVIGQSDLRRIEAIVRCGDPPFDSDSQLELMTWCLQHATAQVRWAIDVGLSPAAVMRKFGQASETHMLLERIR